MRGAAREVLASVAVGAIALAVVCGGRDAGLLGHAASPFLGLAAIYCQALLMEGGHAALTGLLRRRTPLAPRPTPRPAPRRTGLRAQHPLA